MLSFYDPSVNVTYNYDIFGNLLTVNDGVSSYVYTYDTMNRIDSKIILFDAQMAVFSYTYDTLGRQTESSLRLNGGQDRTINIEYDYLGRAISAELTGNALNDILAELDYNAVGALTDVRRFEWDDTDELYNLIAQSQYQYNARNQITSITHQDSNNNNIVSHGYLYNADGNISQYTNSLDGSVLYDYDFLGQLTGADYSNLDITDESYQYDLNGNRELVTNANGDLVVYSTGTNNELNSDGNYSYAYDAEGNRISKTNAAGTERELYVWDYRNRLSSVTKQEYNTTTQEWETVQIVEYAYDYNNVLIRKVLDANGDGVSDSKTIFLPENYQTAIQLDDADLSDSTYETVSHRYLWTPQNQDKLLADIQVSPTGSETLWTLTDHLGTIRDVVKNTPSGLVVPAHVIYDAYGNVLSCKDANGTDIESPVLFGFTGKYFDTDTQLQNNVNRWYDATVGRWLSTDPIGFNGNDTNLYRYVGNALKNDSQGLLTNEQILFAHSMKVEAFIELFNNNLYDRDMRIVYNEYFMDPINRMNLNWYNFTHRTYYLPYINIDKVFNYYQYGLNLDSYIDLDNTRFPQDSSLSRDDIVHSLSYQYDYFNKILQQPVPDRRYLEIISQPVKRQNPIDKCRCFPINDNWNLIVDIRNQSPALVLPFETKYAMGEFYSYYRPSLHFSTPSGVELNYPMVIGLGFDITYNKLWFIPDTVPSPLQTPFLPPNPYQIIYPDPSEFFPFP